MGCFHECSIEVVKFGAPAKMPLVIVSGRPATGKTTFAKELVSFLEENHNKVCVLLNEESLVLNRNDCYAGMTYGSDGVC